MAKQIFLRDDATKHGATTRRHIESSKHGATTRRHIESSNSYDEVASFNSIADAQIDMICYPDEIASFGSMPGNQKDFFLSLFFRCFKTIIF